MSRLHSRDVVLCGRIWVFVLLLIGLQAFFPAEAAAQGGLAMLKPRGRPGSTRKA